MKTIINNSGTVWPANAESSGRRLQAHNKMIELAAYLTELGLTHVPFAGGYDLEGNETQIPEYIDVSSTGVSPWMRFDWSQNTYGKPPIVLYFSVRLGYFFNYQSSSANRRPKYMLITAIRYSESDSNPLHKPNIFTQNTSTVSSSSNSAFTVSEDTFSIGDCFSISENVLKCFFCIDSVGSAALGSSQLAKRSALNLYIERRQEYDYVSLEGNGKYETALEIPQNMNKSGSIGVFDINGNAIKKSSDFAIQDKIFVIQGKHVIQNMYHEFPDEVSPLKECYLAGRTLADNGQVITLDFTGEKRRYLSLASEAFTPGGDANQTILYDIGGVE